MVTLVAGIPEKFPKTFLVTSEAGLEKEFINLGC
jgi:hypothetical protein